MKNKNICIVGAGAWGTAIAKQISRNGHNVILYCREPNLVDEINKKQENKQYLPTIKLEKTKATNDISITEQSDIIFMTTPSQYMRSVLEKMKINKTAEIVICCKGIENETLDSMETIVKKHFPDNNVVILSGPTFAIEVAKGLPTIATLAGKNLKNIESILSSKNLRLYNSDDVIGVEMLGTIKNVIAIACGIIAGKKLGDNAKASLITRGIAESIKLCVVMGGSEKTVLGPAGIGDLILTASSIQSRNMSLGYELGQGKSIDDILKSRKTVAEGIANTKSIVAIAKKNNIEMPICNSVYNIIYNNSDIDKEIKYLLIR
ncbi:MAG: NAD(P)-dependent glycerol-3-phosphate dehydrogenase [Alphaproteobacteria bacterium]|nr:NAD(P)-dependent glycerol-3-phosphate dehydrogenase [Alphaproteobacteria bacterium]